METHVDGRSQPPLVDCFLNKEKVKQACRADEEPELLTQLPSFFLLFFKYLRLSEASGLYLSLSLSLSVQSFTFFLWAALQHI